MSDIDVDIGNFVASQCELLALELKAEEEEEKDLRRRKEQGDDSPSGTLRKLVCSEIQVGLFGRTVAELSRGDDSSLLLPSHRFSVGDEVEIVADNQSRSEGRMGGVLSVVAERHLCVALFNNRLVAEMEGEDQHALDGKTLLSIVPKSAADINRKIETALSELRREGLGHPLASRVIESIFARTKLGTLSTVTIEPKNAKLNETQLEAINFALSETQPLALIHGPPGTGKTSTLAELVVQAAHVFNKKVLVTAPSNVAVDNMLEKILMTMEAETHRQKSKKKKTKSSPNLVRLGHPARIKQSILSYSLESRVQADAGTDVVGDVRRELKDFLKVRESAGTTPNKRRAAQREIKLLRKEIKTRETKVVQEILSTSSVILTTNIGAANRLLEGIEFDLVVIDEAAQAIEASCWIPILRGKKLVLAGDHCQLPPTVRSKHRKVQRELSRSLFERIMEEYDSDHNLEQASRMLQIQYRMDRVIADWASTALYNGKLRTADSVADRPKDELGPMLIIDTTGCAMEEATAASGSRFNEGEAQLVAAYALDLTKAGINPKDIAVISPYNGQVDLLRKIILASEPNIEIRSVDGFQGGEKEAVIISLVRSNDAGEIGFLSDNRRLNVAITRAKKHCCIVCDCDTVSRNPFIEGIVDWVDEHGEHRSALEYEHLLAFPDMSSRRVGLTKTVEKPKIPQKKPQPAKPNEGRRKELLNKVSNFHEHGKPGERMVLSAELTSLERRIVHELATQLGLDHVSEGADGVDRKLTLSIPRGQGGHAVQPTNVARKERPKATKETGQSDDHQTHEKFSFSNLDIGTEGSDSEDLEPPVVENHAQKKDPEPTPQTLHKKKKRKKKKGGAVKEKPPEPDEYDDGDDLAFLDAQIEKVQNSHGRKVEGKGGYRTVINGILMSKPQSSTRPKERNARASERLQANLKSAEQSRKGKKGRKKK